MAPNDTQQPLKWGNRNTLLGEIGITGENKTSDEKGEVCR